MTLGVLLLASMYLYDYLTTTEKLAVREIRVEGARRTGSEKIEQVLSDLKGQNMFKAPLAEYEKRLSMLPRVKQAKLKRVFPSRVICRVTEREPVALVFTNHFMEVDAEGMIMEQDELTPRLDLPIITGLADDDIPRNRMSSNEYLQNALRALELSKKLGGDFADDISEIRTGPEGVKIISISKGSVVLLGSGRLERRLRKFFLLKDTIENEESTAKLIDLRFDDQVVLRSSF
jgi:cell division protein FtsQ